MSQPAIYAFGPFVLDPGRRLLTRGTAPVPLPPKAFDTLLILVEARDRVVTKEELLRRLWPDVVVEEASLTQQIFIVRKALEDGSGGPEAIATIPRLGYRFAAAVREIGEDHSSPQRTGRSIAAWVIGTIAVAGLIGITVQWRRERAASLPMVLTVVPPEGLALSNSIALSPDGRYLAFTAASEDGISTIWLRPVASEEARQLPGTTGALYPFWAPDSRSLGFFANGKLKRLAIEGGPPGVVADAPNPRGGTWGRDDVIVFTPTGGSTLHRVSARGGAAVPLTALDPTIPETGHRWPTFMPDGKHLTFLTRSNRRTDRLQLAIVALSGAIARHRMLTSASSPGLYVDDHLLFVRGRTLLMQPFDVARGELKDRGPFSVRSDVWRSWGYEGLQGCTVARNSVIACRTGSTELDLVWVDRTGTRVGEIDERRAANPDLSPDDSSLAFGFFDEEQEHDSLVLRDLTRGTRRVLTEASDNIEGQVWSPDGTRMVLGSERGGKFDLYLKDLSSNAPPELLLGNHLWKMPEDWSKDGRWVLYSQNDPTSGAQLWALSLADKRAILLTTSRASQGGARFSPNGRWIAYEAVENGRGDIYIRPFPGAGPVRRVSIEGGSEPRWRADGGELYYVAPDRRLMIVDVQDTGREVQLTGQRPLFDQRTYATGYAYSYAVTSDGQRFLISQLRDRGQVAVMLNWRPQ